MEECTFDIFGCKTTVVSDDKRFLDFTSRSLYFFSDKTPQNPDLLNGLKLRIEFSQENFKPPQIAEGYSKIGNDAFARGNEFCFQSGRLLVLVRKIEEKHFVIRAKYGWRASVKGQIKRQIFQSMGRPVDYFLIIRQLIFFPIFWLLESRESTFLLHGSAVAKDQNAIIFSGLAGVGKSINALSLVLNRGYKFLTDNFLLFNRLSIFPFPELIRMSLHAQRIVGTRQGLLGPVLARYGRHYFQLAESFISPPCRATGLFCTTLSRQAYLRPIKADVALDRIMSANDHVREFHHYHFMGLLNSVYLNQKSVYQQRINSLSDLLSGVKMFELGIDPNSDLNFQLNDAIRKVL